MNKKLKSTLDAHHDALEKFYAQAWKNPTEAKKVVDQMRRNSPNHWDELCELQAKVMAAAKHKTA